MMELTKRSRNGGVNNQHGKQRASAELHQLMQGWTSGIPSRDFLRGVLEASVLGEEGEPSIAVEAIEATAVA
jgi:hypothetical protein